MDASGDKRRQISILGSGWLGHPLAERLVSSGCEVKLSTRTAERFPDLEATGARPYRVDLEHPDESMQDFLQSELLVINITAKNIAAFEELVGMIEQAGVARVLFVSSTSVYRNGNQEVYEDSGDEQEETALYQIERLFRQSERFSTTIVRFAGLVGGRRHPARFFKSGRAIQQPDAPVNLIHLDDCLQILARIIDMDIWGQVFNACSDTHPLKRDFYTTAARSLNLLLPEFVETEAPAYKIVNNDKIKRLLGVVLKYPDMMQMLDSEDAFIS